MKSIRLPKVIEVVCLDCNQPQEAVWGLYGSEHTCAFCDSAPINLVKNRK